ncbi:hypothetical protein BDW74DRAFT_179623 [Aspergillus multicolor]|uniref:uncharacterized protein n=1 Tax=Aspergillus multicolor TaxID=41759 RepID=UPI003CCD75B6
MTTAYNSWGHPAQTNTYMPHEMPSLIAAANAASEDHLLAATVYMASILATNEIRYTIMSGFSLRLRGSTRTTHDVDVAVGCSMGRLLEVIRPREWIRRPAGHTAGVIRAFVAAGGDHDHGLPRQIVAVDLTLPGSLGAPEDLSTASEAIPINTPSGQQELVLLDVKSILVAKLGVFFARASAKDFHDLEFLGRCMASQAYAVKEYLNLGHRKAFVCAYSQRWGWDTDRVQQMKHAYGVD